MKTFETLPNTGSELEKIVQKHEQSFSPIKKNNEAHIIWADDEQKEKTDCSIVYLHGFSASHREGDPWHRAVAQNLGCNLYLARLHSHGLQREHLFSDFSYQKLLSSAVDACRIGQQLGEKVILMGTSTGGLLALYAASNRCSVPIDAVVTASPLIHFYGARSLILENKIGRHFARFIKGEDFKHQLIPNISPVEQEVWYPYTPLDAALTLGQMVEVLVKPELFNSIKCPAFVAHYNKNSQQHDRVVSPHAITHMAKQLGTPKEKRQVVNFSEAQSHVIGSGLLSNQVPELIVQTVHFLQNKVI